MRQMKIIKMEQAVVQPRKRRPAHKPTVELDVNHALRLIESQKTLRIEADRDPEY